MFRRKTEPVSSTRFSDFIRKDSVREKKKVYEKVLERASERQRRVLEEVSGA